MAVSISHGVVFPKSCDKLLVSSVICKTGLVCKESVWCIPKTQKSSNMAGQAYRKHLSPGSSQRFSGQQKKPRRSLEVGTYPCLQMTGQVIASSWTFSSPSCKRGREPQAQLLLTTHSHREAQ